MPHERINSLPSGQTAPIRATYADTDRMGYVYHSNYLVWMEIGRTDLLRTMGRTYREWEDTQGIYLPVRHCEIDYRVPAAYDDLVIVRTQISQLSRAAITFDYTIIRAVDDMVLATGMTQHVFTNREGRITRVDPELIRELSGSS